MAMVGGNHWRGLMDSVRAVGTALWSEGLLRVTQKGIEVDPRTSKGALRYSVPSSSGSGGVL